MSVACYKCGAYPGHSTKTLDVLKLIKCTDCGTVACVSHREGLVGGKCAICGSTRSTIAAFKKGNFGGDKPASTGLDGGGASAPADTGSVSISAAQLENMQTERNKAMQEGQARLAEQHAKQAQEKLSVEERKRQEELESQLAGLFGNSDFVKSSAGLELVANINAQLPEGIRAEDLIVTLGDEKGSSEKSNNFKNATTVLATAVNHADIASQVKSLMASESFNDGTSGLDFSEDSSLKNVTAQTMVSTEKVGETCDINNASSVKKQSKVHKITLLDSFNVKSNYRVMLDDVIKIKNQSAEEITKFLIKEFNLDDGAIDLTLKVNNFIPLDYIDHLLNLHPEDLKKENINIITGVLAQKITFDTVSYVDQFAFILPQKPYIKGVYASFANNPEYSYEEQKELNLQLLDMAQENDKIVYLGLDNSPISHWKEIFDEYDLSEISFIYTEVIDDQETLDFVKDNNIKILVRPDVSFDYYAEILAEYKNFCFGSAFERIIESTDEKVANSTILGETLKNMHNINPELIESLLNLED